MQRIFSNHGLLESNWKAKGRAITVVLAWKGTFGDEPVGRVVNRASLTAQVLAAPLGGWLSSGGCGSADVGDGAQVTKVRARPNLS
jgi:hypothetical protein